MTAPSSKARWSVEIDRDLNSAIDRHVPWGMKSAVLRELIRILSEALERSGPAVLGAILAGEMELRLKESALESLGRSRKERKHNVGRGASGESPSNPTGASHLAEAGEDANEGEADGSEG